VLELPLYNDFTYGSGYYSDGDAVNLEATNIICNSNTTAVMDIESAEEVTISSIVTCSVNITADIIIDLPEEKNIRSHIECNAIVSGDIIHDLPVIQLIGSEWVKLNLGDDYQELGAVAYDLQDGDISDDIIIDDSDLDTDKIGDYFIKYDVQDSSGNSAFTVLRRVSVIKVYQKNKIDYINFRNRGPNESHKNNKVMNDTQRSINDAIALLQELTDNTNEKTNEILYNIRRRGYYGTTKN
jgi:hypothetical protein